MRSPRSSIIRSSYHQGFARSSGESAYPDDWKGLVGAWIPSLGKTGNILREQIQARNGVLVGMDPLTDWVRHPEQGLVLDLDGTAQGIDLAGNLPLAEKTISIWAMLRPQGQGGGTPYDFFLLTSKSGTSTNSFIFYFDNGVDFRFLPLAPSTGTGLLYTVAIDDGLFHNIVYRRAPGRHSLWIDGVEVVSNTDPTTLGGTLDCWLGGTDTDSATRNWDGQIGSMLVYNRALTNMEMVNHYKNPLRFLQLKKRPAVFVPVAAGRISRYHSLSGLGGQGQMTWNPLG